jgi:hypothetical protein
MKQCHSTECEIVLGVAIAAEASLLAGDAFSWIPGVGGAVDTAAWFAQMGNRIGHNVITFTLRVAKMLSGLVNKLKFLKPLVTLLSDLAGLNFVVSYRMSLDMLLVYVPIIINGFLCILIGFWRRENVHKIFQTYSVIITFYVPLMALNVSMVGLMYLFPVVVSQVCNIIPKSVMIVTSHEHVGFTLLRTAYIISTVGTFVLLLSSLMDDAYYMRRKVKVIRDFFRLPFKKKADNGDPAKTGFAVDDYVNNGWFQAFFISSPIFILFAMSYHYDWEFVNVEYGPSGQLLKVVNAFHGHTNLLRDVKSHNEWVDENSLCGLIGKAVDAAIHEVIKVLGTIGKDLEISLEKFLDSVFDFSHIISTFENTGKKAVDILEDTWNVAEKTLVLIVPVGITIMLFIMSILLPHVKKENKSEIKKIATQIAMIGIYYNIALIVMMQQLFSTISNMKLHVFYFQFTAGPLVAIGFIASALNAMSVFSLFVEKIYKTE